MFFHLFVCLFVASFVKNLKTLGQCLKLLRVVGW